MGIKFVIRSSQSQYIVHNEYRYTRIINDLPWIRWFLDRQRDDTNYDQYDHKQIIDLTQFVIVFCYFYNFEYPSSHIDSPAILHCLPLLLPCVTLIKYFCLLFFVILAVWTTRMLYPFSNTFFPFISTF